MFVSKGKKYFLDFLFAGERRSKGFQFGIESTVSIIYKEEKGRKKSFCISYTNISHLDVRFVF